MSSVLESALPAWVKPYAVAFASFAADDGTKVFPSQARIARMLAKSERQVRRAVRELRRLRVLVIVAPSGRATAARYYFAAERLPIGGDGEQIDLFTNVSQFPQVKRSNSGAKQRFPQRQQQLTGHGCPVYPDMGVRRSVIDPSSTQRTRAREKTGTE